MKADRASENVLVVHARKDARDYVTPEDVGALLESGVDPTRVRLDLLEVIGVGPGCEDAGLCAFVAWDWPRRDTEAGGD